VALHYLCDKCYDEDDGEPKNAGKEIIRLERERDEARKECERWRDAVILHIGHVVTPDRFPWEDGKPPANFVMAEKLPEPEECDECGEPDFNPNWLPEGQCVCDECAVEYWEEENADVLEP
jgi:formylmethanofuran dehydrogenase subunit E